MGKKKCNVFQMALKVSKMERGEAKPDRKPNNSFEPVTKVQNILLHFATEQSTFLLERRMKIYMQSTIRIQELLQGKKTQLCFFTMQRIRLFVVSNKTGITCSQVELGQGLPDALNFRFKSQPGLKGKSGWLHP